MSTKKPTNYLAPWRGAHHLPANGDYVVVYYGGNDYFAGRFRKRDSVEYSNVAADGVALVWPHIKAWMPVSKPTRSKR